MGRRREVRARVRRAGVHGERELRARGLQRRARARVAQRPPRVAARVRRQVRPEEHELRVADPDPHARAAFIRGPAGDAQIRPERDSRRGQFVRLPEARRVEMKRILVERRPLVSQRDAARRDVRAPGEDREADVAF